VRKHEGREEKVVDLYPDGYSITWREHEDMSVDDIEWSHYIAKYKEHEANRTSTNERNKYWNEYRRSKEAGGDK
jgi:ActR/RegA family two-component response regulator